MVTYVIYESSDGTEHGITAKDRWTGFLRTDADGNPMKVVLEFEAETWEYAMQVYNDHYGYGKYIPMDQETLR